MLHADPYSVSCLCLVADGKFTHSFCRLNAELSIELGTLSISKAENTSSSDSPSESGKVAGMERSK